SPRGLRDRLGPGMTAANFSFGPFELDLAAGGLRRDGRPVALPPRELAVLRCLVLRAGQVVPIDTILESVWGDTFVTRGVVPVAIRQVRSTLGDSYPHVSFIETVGRRGYRFIAPLRSETGAAAPPLAPGRATELQRLESAFEDACAGTRRLIFVSGGPAAGKSALVNAFMDRLEHAGAAWCAVGRCVAQSAPCEPYLPALEALRTLCEGPIAGEVVAALRRHAPLWLARMPGLLTPAARETLARELRTLHAPPEAMLRQFADGAEAIASIRPLVGVLENLQWSDGATVDLLAFLAARRNKSRLMVVSTFRADELPDPIGSLRRGLNERGVR